MNVLREGNNQNFNSLLSNITVSPGRPSALRAAKTVNRHLHLQETTIQKNGSSSHAGSPLYFRAKLIRNPHYAVYPDDGDAGAELGDAIFNNWRWLEGDFEDGNVRNANRIKFDDVHTLRNNRDVDTCKIIDTFDCLSSMNCFLCQLSHTKEQAKMSKTSFNKHF